MPEPGKTSEAPDAVTSGDDLKARISAFVDALVQRDAAAYEAEFGHLLGRVQELVERKLKMEGTKTDTRDFLGELLFTRLRRGMKQFLQNDDEVVSRRASEWVMGVLCTSTTLVEFAKAFDQALLRRSNGAQDFNFAGRTDFISVEEVLQMLASGKHLGCLSLEKADNRIDIYLKEGRIYFLDPHNMIRRVMPTDSMRHREIPEAQITQAQAARTQKQRPVLLALHDQGVFKKDELKEIVKLFGKEVMFDFMREQEPYAFYYKKLDRLPDYATEHDVRLGVTSILLEGSKQVDDWKQMLQVFPNPDAPIEPKPDMFARMADSALAVLELKLLSQINGEITPRGLVAAMGLPMFDIYQMLIKLCRDGIIASPAGAAALSGLALSVEEAMQEAFAALDANDDREQRRSAIDKVFGGESDGASALERALGGGATGGGGRKTESALDRVFGGDAGGEDREKTGLLGILRKPRK
jgi:hypothetical protein